MNTGTNGLEMPEANTGQKVFQWRCHILQRHCIILVGKVSKNVYQVLDLWNGSVGLVWNIFINGNRINYSKGNRFGMRNGDNMAISRSCVKTIREFLDEEN